MEEAKARWWDKHKSKIENGIFFGDKVGGPDDYDSAHRQHQVFDSISPNRGINARKQIAGTEAIEDSLREVHDAARDMREFGNKFIAHAVAPTSRATLTVNQQGVSIDKIESVLGRLTSVAARFSLILFGANHVGSLPVPQYDVRDKLDKP